MGDYGAPLFLLAALLCSSGHARTSDGNEIISIKKSSMCPNPDRMIEYDILPTGEVHSFTHLMADGFDDTKSKLAKTQLSKRDTAKMFSLFKASHFENMDGDWSSPPAEAPQVEPCIGNFDIKTVSRNVRIVWRKHEFRQKDERLRELIRGVDAIVNRYTWQPESAR